MSEAIYPSGCVYDWIPKEQEEIKKPPRPAIILEEKLNKDAKKTMGPPKVELPSPDKYLKKHSKQPKPPEKSDDGHKPRTCTVRKPTVPRRTEKPLMGIQTKRDFLQTTVMFPMKPKAISVDTKKGHKQLLENSGLVPKYVMKKDYGEVPTYLQLRSEAERKAREEDQTLAREQNVLERLTEEDHQAVLKGLKKKWDELHCEYQGLPLLIDTPSKKTRKIRLEEKMSQLEKDISFFERFKTIFIYDD
ncbi:enkurin-like isoform X2 [Poeciliopsis prolifica]|uniref:enkurin-like isoform X2 n=1 Tax=Poeciliopsis prolifica TaxID=188132 RepID=UPI00241423DE|nr:enkurin-like isoform X2 [Poeciliopsis prolifica]